MIEFFLLFTAYTLLFERLPEPEKPKPCVCEMWYPGCFVAQSGWALDVAAFLFAEFAARMIYGFTLLFFLIQIKLVLEEVVGVQVELTLLDPVAHAVRLAADVLTYYTRSMIVGFSATTCGVLSPTSAGFEICRKQMAHARHMFLHGVLAPLDAVVEFVADWEKPITRMWNFVFSFIDEYATVLRYACLCLLFVFLIGGLAFVAVHGRRLTRFWRLLEVLRVNPGLDENNVEFIRSGNTEIMVARSQEINVRGVWKMPVAG